MIIRTSIGERAAGAKTPAVPGLSQREMRRLAHTKHPARLAPKVVEEKKEEEIPVVIEEVREDAVAANAVAEPGTVVIRSKALAEANETIVTQESESAIVKPGTAKIRSKVLEEINETVQTPRKKYKVISIGGTK